MQFMCIVLQELYILCKKYFLLQTEWVLDHKKSVIT
jgi:hypothetical protein